MRAVVVVVVVVVSVARGLPAGALEPGAADGAARDPAGSGPVAYVPPVPGGVVDPWRGPSSPFGPGNRGIDLAASPGEVVRAAADGEVVFAGPVAGSRHIVVLHPDGLRTTYAFLATTSVQRGDHVNGGDEVGTASGPVHFGVRAGDEYLDPGLVLVSPPTVHLVPAEDRRPGTVAGERRGLVRFLGGALRAGVDAAAWLAGRTVVTGVDVAGWAAEVGWTVVESEVESLLGTTELALRYLRQPVELLVAMRQMVEYLADQRRCTPADRRPPPAAVRHIAVLVAGFGSDGRADAISGLDTRALGYRAADVVQFSYRGGVVGRPNVPGASLFPGVNLPGTTGSGGYSPADAGADLAVSAGRLRQLLVDVRAANPGVPIDVIGHSQGGLVARAALADSGGPGPAPPDVANLVTIGTPHRGADLATATAWLSSSAGGAIVVAGVGAAAGADGFSTAAQQLAEGSSFLRGLAGTSVRAGRFTSIASAGDIAVTANQSAVAEAVNVLVPGRPGVDVHGDLPASEPVQREVALALAGMGPTCRSLLAGMGQAVALSMAEDVVGGTAGAAGLYVDRGLGQLTRALGDPVPRRPSCRSFCGVPSSVTGGTTPQNERGVTRRP